MITQKELQELNITSIEEFYKTVVEYQEQNKYFVVETMLNKLGKAQRKMFALYLLNILIKDNGKLELLTTLINEL